MSGPTTVVCYTCILFCTLYTIVCAVLDRSYERYYMRYNKNMQESSLVVFRLEELCGVRKTLGVVVEIPFSVAVPLLPSSIIKCTLRLCK